MTSDLSVKCSWNVRREIFGLFVHFRETIRCLNGEEFILTVSEGCEHPHCKTTDDKTHEEERRL